MQRFYPTPAEEDFLIRLLLWSYCRHDQVDGGQGVGLPSLP